MFVDKAQTNKTLPIMSSWLKSLII